MKKYIFLDIDGVLNAHHNTVERWGGFIGIDPKHVAIFNKLVEETGAEIVLSSAWRSDPDWHKTMTANGIVDKFLGKTKHLPTDFRGIEIAEWLDSNAEKPFKYAILDDNSDMLPDQKEHFFKTKWDVGLTEEIAELVKQHLNKPVDNPLQIAV